MIRRFSFLILVLVLATASFDPFGTATIEPRIGAQVPFDTLFTDSHGGRVTLRELGGGRPILLAPVLHNCPNICGVELDNLADALVRSGLKPGRDVSVIALGIDPEEGPADAAASMERLHERRPALGTVHALTGRARPVTAALGYRYGWDERIGQFAHIAAVAVITPDGHLSRWLRGLALSPDGLRTAVNGAAKGEAGDWTDRLLLLCYHYDPEQGRYTVAIGWILRIAGLATILVLGGFLLVSHLRERRR